MKLLLETLLTVAQNGVNYALSLDEHTQQALIPLHGRTIAIHVEKIDHTLYLEIENKAVYFSLLAPKHIDLKISAHLKDLWSLSQRNQTPKQQVHMQGNMHVAQHLSKIIHEFEPDWEEALAQVSGDVAAHAFAQTLRGAHAYAKQVAHTIMRNSADYMIDELSLVAPKASIDHFIDNVNNLRTQCDRLSVRVNLCKQRV